jgi:hypothetical protein
VKLDDLWALLLLEKPGLGGTRKKTFKKIDSIKYASNKKGEGTVRLTIHQRA